MNTHDLNDIILEKKKKKYNLCDKIRFGVPTLWYLTIGYYTNRKQYFIYKQLWDRVNTI